jgi:hypothetical protein
MRKVQEMTLVIVVQQCKCTNASELYFRMLSGQFCYSYFIANLNKNKNSFILSFTLMPHESDWFSFTRGVSSRK